MDKLSVRMNVLAASILDCVNDAHLSLIAGVAGGFEGGGAGSRVILMK